MNEPVKRWTAQRKSEVILQILKKEKNLVEICRTNDLKQSEIQQWLDDFLKAGRDGLKTNSKDAQFQHQKQIKQLQAKIGELVMEVEARKKWQAMLDDQEEKRF